MVADQSPRWPRYRRRVLRASRWLAFGALVSFATSWGCIFWRVFVAFNWVPAGGVNVPMMEWPFEFGETWSPPTKCEETMGLGYHKIEASDLRAPDENNTWIDFQQLSDEYFAAAQRAFDALQSGGSKGSTVVLQEANLRYANARSRTAHCVLFQRQAGWPLRCMESRYVSRTPTNGGGSTFLIGEEFSEAGSARASWRQLYDRGVLWPAAWAPPSGTVFTIPLRPIWPRFALNALIWAGAGWGVSAAFAARRRRARHRAGECRRCCYCVVGLAICPECGTPTERSDRPTLPVATDV